ncbi:MAG: UDP-N-acetylmuramoyl-tripeptide--D-alanyl-D-alanine ligase [Brevirhabdus sp.]
MSVLWTSNDAVAATGGRSTCEWQATGVSIDTRSIQQGELFVALQDVRDGHDFVAQALEKGAAAALVSRVPEAVSDDAPLLIVDDVLPALEALGRASRERTEARVIAVTGSVGKTSTKEMLRAALRGQGVVHAAEKSFNNHWGVPLTLARMPAQSDFAVIEIGMNHPGEIAPLVAMARPHVAVVTTVAAAHLEAFQDVAAIAHEKAAIYSGLEPDGIAILNGDIDTAPILHTAAARATRHVVTFGEADGNDYRLSRVTISADATVGQCASPEGTLTFKLAAPGRHFARNAMAVVAAVDAVGADMGVAMSDLGRWHPPAGRGTRERLILDPVLDGMVLDLIDDAYNANPTSMAAALEVLAAQEPVDGVGRVNRGRRIAVLGDMLELGAEEVALHTALADLSAMKAVAQVHCVGPRMQHLFNALPSDKRGHWVSAAPDMAERIRGLVDAGDVVLVKGSLGSRVGLVVDAIRKLGQADRATSEKDE